jgi:hypothetical protein
MTDISEEVEKKIQMGREKFSDHRRKRVSKIRSVENLK